MTLCTYFSLCLLWFAEALFIWASFNLSLILHTSNVNGCHVSLVTQWFFYRGVGEQTKAFMTGFNEVIPLQWLQYFDEREFEVCYMLVSGHQKYVLLNLKFAFLRNPSHHTLFADTSDLLNRCSVCFWIFVLRLHFHWFNNFNLFVCTGINYADYFATLMPACLSSIHSASLENFLLWLALNRF